MPKEKKKKEILLSINEPYNTSQLLELQEAYNKVQAQAEFEKAYNEAMANQLSISGIGATTSTGTTTTSITSIGGTLSSGPLSPFWGPATAPTPSFGHPIVYVTREELDKLRGTVLDLMLMCEKMADRIKELSDRE